MIRWQIVGFKVSSEVPPLLLIWINTVYMTAYLFCFFFYILPFIFATWCFTRCSNCWLIPLGASSEFRPLSVIYRGRKDKKEDVTKTTVDTFTLHTGLGWMEKKAYNYVSSLTAIQLPDYKDRTCTSWWIHPNRSDCGTECAACKQLSDNNIL